FASSTASRSPSSRASAMAAASPICSTRCTASRPIRRATSTRRKPIAVSVCRSSCTKVSRPSPSRTRARCGRPRRALTDGLTRQGQDEKIVLPLPCSIIPILDYSKPEIALHDFHPPSHSAHPAGPARPAHAVLSRRDFLAASLLVPAFARQTSEARLLGSVPLGNPGGTPAAPLERLLGSGLDARLFTNLSTIDRRDSSTLITPNDRFYIRTAAPASTGEKPAGFEAALQRSSKRAGPYVMECAGNADPANFGLISAATWEGVPLNAMLDRMRAPANRRVLVSGADHPGPSMTSVPGASWIFTPDQLDRALLAY